jgi:hypothetical protein
MATAASTTKDANHHARQHELDANLHYPKGYINADVNSLMGVDETDSLIWEQRYLLPAALNYVSAVTAPPTEINGDIYVLSDAVGTVHASWDGCAKDDWVRYNSAAALWYAITPLEGFVFFNKTDNTLYTYDGTTWNATGGSGTVTSVSGTANRVTSTGGVAPIIDISATFEALLAKVAQRIDQNNAATTSAQLASIISDETGTGALVFANTPTLVTPVLGVATATSVNGTTIPSSKTLVVTTDKLNVLAATTSAELAGIISDETGSGALVFANTPTLVTPVIGAATGTSLVLSSFINEAKGADIASATTTDIGAATGNFIHVTGTTTITGLGTIQAGTRRIVKFTGALTLTHNATSLILPSSANITTVAGDIATFISLGSGNWICSSYQKVTITGTGSAVQSVSPTFTGSPIAPTQTALDNSTKIATTAYVDTNANKLKCYGSEGSYSAVTNGSDEVAYSILIPAGTIVTGDQFHLDGLFSLNSSAGAKTFKWWLHTLSQTVGTTISASGSSTQIAQSGAFTSGSLSGVIQRRFGVRSNTSIIAWINGTTSFGLDGSSANFATTAITIPTLASDVYLVATLNKATLGDTITAEYMFAKIFKK